MGNKRHFKGASKAEDKKRRKEFAENWKNTRGDDPQNQSSDQTNQARRQNNRGDGWSSAIPENARFEAFYKCQGFISVDDSSSDWDNFIKYLRMPLPACFRICPDYAFASALRSQLLSLSNSVCGIDGKDVEGVEELKWVPSKSAYKLGADRRSIRKLDNLKQLHAWMKQHTDNGNITRQEAVSMVPPLALDVQPHHYCLDMCAAPGSKTSQLLEIVNRSLLYTDETKQGLVVANDSDTDRAYMLVHQCRRINSPSLIVTTHMGQLFPTVYSTPDEADPTTGILHSTQLLFDRVLCDVPCSGDGTLRKNPAIWSKWNTSSSMTLHPLQLLIAQRGLQLLKEGGLMVYSTCSMSPYENESVVAELLRTSNGSLELVDARDFLPLFKARRGLSDWFVLDDYLAIKQERHGKKTAEPKQSSVDITETAVAEKMDIEIPEAVTIAAEAVVEPTKEVAEHPALLQACIDMGMTHFPSFEHVPSHLSRKIRKSMFPPTPAEASWMHLERCLRCVPQDEDTGGFFVATLRKKSVGKSSGNNIPAAVNAVEVGVIGADGNAIVEAAAAAAAVTELEQDGQAQPSDGATIEEHTLKVPAQESSETGKAEDAKKDFKPHFKGLVEFLPWEKSEFDRIRDFYGIAEGALSVHNFFIREDMNNHPGRGKKDAVSGKCVYYIPYSSRRLLKTGGDRSNRLKVVTAGVKAFERKNFLNGEHDYRLLQDGITYLAPLMTKRKVSVNVQDFCNILSGGLVSYSTLSASTLHQLAVENQTGSIVVVYTYSPSDVLTATSTSGIEGDVEKASDPLLESSTTTKMDMDAAGASAVQVAHSFHAICWKGHSRSLNVMCGKIDMESMKHQLEVLNVLRPKVFPPKLAVPTATDAAADLAVTGEDAEKSTGLDHAADADAAGEDEDYLGRGDGDDDDGNVLDANSENIDVAGGLVEQEEEVAEDAGVRESKE